MTTYKQFEISVDDGLPVELYEISYSSMVWRYTTNVEDVDFEDLTLYSFGKEIKPYEYYLDDGETKDFNMETHIRILSC